MSEDKQTTRGAEIIEGLTLLRDTIRKGIPLADTFTVREVSRQTLAAQEGMRRYRDALRELAE